MTLKAKIRFFQRFRLYFLVNIIGLGTAIAITLLAGLFIYRELSHDKFNTNLRNIYCVSVDGKGFSPYILAEGMADRIPALSSFTRTQLWDLKFNVLRCGDNPPVDLDGIIRADTNFFEFFDYRFISGDPRSCLNIPESLVLTESSALKLFGKEEPVGKTVSYNQGQMLLTVTAVVKDPPANCSIKFNAVMSVKSLPTIYPPYRESGAFFWNFESFVSLDDIQPDTAMNRLASEIFLQHIPESAIKEAQSIFKSKFEVKLLPFSSIYFTNEYQTSLKKGNNGQVYLFSVIGILIMIVAIINYINLANASATARIREVIIRKFTGARTLDLFAGFLSESVFVSFIAFALGLLLSAILTVFVNRQQITSNPLEFYGIKEQVIILFGGSILTGIVAGVWPSLTLATVNPVVSEKNNVLSGAMLLRRSLLVVQFFISAGLLITTLIISRQYGYMTTNPAGFNSENIIYLKMGRQLKKSFTPLTDRLTRLAGISAIATARYGFIGDRSPSANVLVCNGKELKMDAMFFNTDTGFMEMLGLEMILGNSFREHDNITNKLIINETALKMTGLQGNLNEITLPDKVHNKTWQVVGVVRDFNSRSMQYSVSPYIMYYTPGDADMDGLYIKIHKEAANTELVNQIKDICFEFAPGEPVNIEFLDEAKALLYSEDENKKKIFLFFTVFSILISCMGLYALAGFMLERRTKEIGLRKVCGADDRTIFRMIASDFLKIILTGFILVLPLSWFIMNKWLENFALKTRLAWWIFVISGVIIVLVAAISVFAEIRKATACNPADIIRSE